MSDRADFLAGIAASGCGSPFGIHGDFGTFDGPYPYPSPPSGAYDILDHDMSDDYHSSIGEDHSGDDTSTSKISKPKTKTLKNLSGLPKRKFENKKALELTDLMAKKKHKDLDTRVSLYKWALAQLPKRWHRRFQKAVKEHDFLASDRRLKDMKTEKGRKKQRAELLSRPLSEVPFNTEERKFVEGLFSLLMRLSESVARRPWPKARGSTQILKEMKSEEHFLDALRKLIEKNWPCKAQGRAKHKPIEVVIDKVREIDENIHGCPLLPSTKCIRPIILIVNAAYRIETRSPDDDHCAMPRDCAEEFEYSLKRIDAYDAWRATNPPDSERLLDFMWGYWQQTAQNKRLTSST